MTCFRRSISNTRWVRWSSILLERNCKSKSIWMLLPDLSGLQVFKAIILPNKKTIYKWSTCASNDTCNTYRMAQVVAKNSQRMHCASCLHYWDTEKRANIYNNRVKCSVGYNSSSCRGKQADLPLNNISFAMGYGNIPLTCWECNNISWDNWRNESTINIIQTLTYH